MCEPYPKRCTAFAGFRRIATGDLAKVALKARAVIKSGEQAPVLIFDDLTSDQLEVDIRGPVKDVLARLEKSAGKGKPKDVSARPGADATPGPGRPKLGVIGREVTLLPRHWDWLNSQPGGASVTLRKLVEAAKRANAGQDRIRAARESTYRFMAAMAGNLPGFEEAARALFARKKDRFKEFEKLASVWPRDIRRHASKLMKETIRMEETAARAGQKGRTPAVGC
jgi:hypothetical protein